MCERFLCLGWLGENGRSKDEDALIRSCDLFGFANGSGPLLGLTRPSGRQL